MKHVALIPISLLALAATTSAADPAWWAARGVINTSPSSNLSPATIGQAKHMVSTALAELRTHLEAPVFNSLRDSVTEVVNLTIPTTDAGFQEQRGILLVGQLKAIADPFYRQLDILAPGWLALQRQENLTQDLANPSQIFPWTLTTTDDANMAIVTIGQLKAVFALRFELLGMDGDDFSEAQEQALGTSLLLSDTDGDGVSDSVDFFPLDSSRWLAPTSIPGDSTPPLVTLSTPASATPVSGP